MFLSDEELESLTGYKRPADQRRWLTSYGWTFEVRADGKNRVLIEEARSRMLTRHVARQGRSRIWRRFALSFRSSKMARRRKSNKHLPNRVYLHHGAYFFVDHQGKWHRLGKTLAEMYRAYAELVDERPIRSMGDLFDEYMNKVVPNQSTTNATG